MAYCSQCGANGGDAKFCASCGTALVRPEAGPAAAPAPAPLDPTAPWGQPAPARKESRTALLAGVAVLIIALVAGGTFLLLRTEKYPDDVRTAFLQSCQESGAARSNCVCALEEFEEKYSFDEYKRLEARVLAAESPADLPDEVVDVYADCR